jgi:hypothetical protein
VVLGHQEGQPDCEYEIQIDTVNDPSFPTGVPLKLEELVIEELPCKLVKTGAWDKDNSKGTYRILTDNF